MRPRLRIAMAIMEIVLLLLVAFFEPTYSVRAWLRGESYFDGKPTSFWRGEIDRWLGTFASREDAIRSIAWDPNLLAPNFHGCVLKDNFFGNSMFEIPEPTLWERGKSWFRPPAPFLVDLVDLEPKILRGDPEAEPVLRELERNPTYRPIVSQVRKNVAMRR